jgi:hypothetical protein
MSNDLVEHVVLREGGVHMRRVNVSGHCCEDLDVFECQRMHQAGGVTDLQLVEGSVLYAIHHLIAHISEANSRHDVKTRINVFDIPGKRRCGITHQKRRYISDILNAHELMLGRASASPLQ